MGSRRQLPKGNFVKHCGVVMRSEVFAQVDKCDQSRCSRMYGADGLSTSVTSTTKDLQGRLRGMERQVRCSPLCDKSSGLTWHIQSLMKCWPANSSGGQRAAAGFRNLR